MITRRVVFRSALLAAGAPFLTDLTIPTVGLSAEAMVALQGAGSTFAAPLYATWISVYRQVNNEVSLRYDAVGSSEGVTRLAVGNVDFAATDILPCHWTFTAIKRGAIPVPVTAGMIVLAYNLPGVAGALKLPRGVYPDIFSGRITKWNDPRIRAANPLLILPNQDIAVIVRDDASGTTAEFTRHLVAIGAGWHATGAGDGYLVDWPRVAMRARGNEGVASKIKLSEGSIGFVEYGFAQRLGLAMATLENQAGRFVEPTPESGQSALLTAEDESIIDPEGESSYPLVTFSWLLLYKKYSDPKRSAALKDWVRWGLTTGQTIAPGLGYLPLPPEKAQMAAKSLDAIA
jgi:phosphate transport system substrate-binding protein